MLTFFNKTFNIQDGEVRVALLMQLYIFLVITVLLLVKSTVNALFLTELGANQLPKAFLIVAVVAILTSMLYNKLTEWFSIRSIAVSTILIFSVLFFVLAYVVSHQILDTWVLYFYYVSLSIFGVMVTSQFWIIANLVFDVREAKRLFGFIGAGAIAGGVFGGYLTSVITNYFGNGIVMLVAVGLLLGCLPIIFTIWHIRIREMNRFVQKKREKKEQKLSSSSLKLILSSKHLTNLAVIAGISVLVAKLIDYQFSEFSNNAYQDSNELASFFGFWFSSFNVIAILIQLFLTNRLLAYFGVASNLLFLPIGLALGSLLFLAFPELWVVILLKGVDGSFKQSINKASFELSILPVPFDTKKKAKPFIDVVVDSVATGLAGLILLILVQQLSVPTAYITIITLFFLFIWLIFIYRLRGTFFNTFRQNIKISVDSGKDQSPGFFPEGSLRASNIEILENGSEEEVLALLGNLSDQMTLVYKPYILNLLEHPSNNIKATAIQKIYNFPYGTATDTIKRIIEKNDHDKVVYEAMAYLLFHTSQNEDRLFAKYLDHPKDYIKNAALLCLARASRYNKKISKKFGLKKRIKSQINEFSKDENAHREEEISELLMTIGISGKREFYHFIEEHLSSDRPMVTKYAIMASGSTLNENFVIKLLDLMKYNENAPYCKEVLQLYGKSISKILLKINDSGVISNQVAGYIPSIIADFQTKSSFKLLLKLMDRDDTGVRFESSKILAAFKEGSSKFSMSRQVLDKALNKECHNIKTNLSAIKAIEDSISQSEGEPLKDSLNEHDPMVIRDTLLEHLNQRIRESFHVIYYNLGYEYDISDLELAYFGLRGTTSESRTNTIEYLDNLLNSRIRKDIIPLIEYYYSDRKVVNLPFEVRAEQDALVALIELGDPQTMIYALQLIRLLDTGPVVDLIRELKLSPDTRIAALAQEILTDN